VPNEAVSALDRARRKAYWRLLPVLFVAYAIAYIDRSNLGLAKVAMGNDLGLDSDTFGSAAGYFFLGYFLLEVPGAVIVERWSARKWISRIMVTWGILAALTAVVTTPGQLKLMRFLLGLAEAGFFPGVIIYLTHWFTERDRARALAMFIVAAPAAQMVNPILSYPILRIGTTQTSDGLSVTYPLLWGMSGWQWNFIVWGIPAVVLGIFILFYLTDRPSQAHWLTSEERRALEAELLREKAGAIIEKHDHLAEAWRAMKDPRVLLLAAANFSIVCGHYGVEFFLPSIFERWYGFQLNTLAWVVPLPFLAMMTAQILMGWNSDRTGERWWHTAAPMFVGSAAFLLTPLSQGSFPLSLLCFAVAMAGIRSYLAPFFTLPKMFLRGTAAASGIGLINAIGNLGGYVGPKALGVIDKTTGSYVGGILFLGATSALAGGFILTLRRLYGRR
jgi:ACS family tartrate transporter-like MFS transporter